MPALPHARERNPIRPIIAFWALLALSACSGSNDSAPPEEAVESAAEVCDGVIRGTAADHLEELAMQEEFTGRGNQSASPPDLENYLERLLDAPEGWEPYCEIYTPANESFATIDFRWEGSVSTLEQSGLTILFDAGELAHATDSAAYIEFHCPVGAPSGDYLVGNFFTYSGRAGEQHMAIANAVSRVLAEELGCLEGANLPEGDPQVIGE